MNYVTGASGFIGSRLLKKLKATCHSVAIKHEDIRWWVVAQSSRIFFLSSYGNLVHQTQWDQIVQANILDVVRMLEYVPMDCQFVFVSSSSVGLTNQTAYSHCKRAAEEILLSSGRDVLIIRPFSVTGVGDHKIHLIPKLIHSCLSGEQMAIYPNANHDWIDVDDVVDGIITLSNAKAKGIFELGTGTMYSNLEVMEMVEEATGTKAAVRTGPARIYDSVAWCCTDMSAQQYGWMPKKSLKQSIKEMVQAYQP